MLADVVILTVQALEIAAGEKDGARSAVAAEGIFLSKVGSIAGDDRCLAGPADTIAVSIDAIDTTAAGTDIARTEALVGPLNSMGQFPGRKQLVVGYLDRISHSVRKNATVVRLSLRASPL
jgi:hypothetical protein